MQKCHLYIFMDSCFSGAWAYKLGDMGNKGISIFASSDRNQTSIDINGGQLFKSIMGNENQIDATWNTLKRYQNPVFINKTDRVIRMEKQHLKLLNQNIANVSKILSGGTPYTGSAPIGPTISPNIPVNNTQGNTQPQQQQSQPQNNNSNTFTFSSNGGASGNPNVQYIIEGA